MARVICHAHNMTASAVDNRVCRPSPNELAELEIRAAHFQRHQSRPVNPQNRQARCAALRRFTSQNSEVILPGNADGAVWLNDCYGRSLKHARDWR